MFENIVEVFGEICTAISVSEPALIAAPENVNVPLRSWFS